MAFEPFSFDVHVHSKLGDDPNVDNNLTADDLKALFDSPMVAFKEYINETLIPALDSFSPDNSVAVFIQRERPQYSPCFWFRPASDGTRDMIYIDKDGVQTTLTLHGSGSGGNVQTEIADGSITPKKLDREYFAKKEPMVLVEGVHYGTTLPAPGTKGRLYFKKVT